MNHMLSHAMAWATAACALLALPAIAGATSYAALEERPATGGELRFADPDGQLDENGNRRLGFPLTLTRVTADISGAMAEVLVEQVFENPIDRPIEAVYVFPMAVDAAVNAYSIQIGDRLVEGQIRRRAEAREIYEQARDAGRTTGLLEEDQRNVFVQHIANIAPGETITVRFRYVELLKYEHGAGYTFAYPLTMTPRYLGPGESASSRQPEFVEATVSGARVEFDVTLDGGVPLRAVESSTHRIVVEREETTARVALAPGDDVPNKDFVLRYDPAGEQTLATVLSHRDDALGGYYALMVQPKLAFREDDITPREVIILLDRSGSMAGDPFDRSKAVAEMILDSLTPRDRVNIVTFASATGQFLPGPQWATADVVGRARRYVRELSASGGTELDDGLRRALAQPPNDGRVRMVYIFTDGGVGDDEAAIELVRDPDGHNRLFPIGVGAAPNRHLIDRLAEEGRGFPTYLDLWQSTEEVGDRLVRKTQWPYLTDLTVEFVGLDVEDAGPFRVPDVYAGTPLVVTGRYGAGGQGQALIRGYRAGRRLGMQVPVTLPEDVENRPVAFVWLADEINRLQARPDADSTEVVERITTLGLNFSVVTPYTSFVAVDDGRAVEGDLTTVDQPLEAPAGSGGRPSGSGGGSSGGGSSGGGSSSGGWSWGGSSSDGSDDDYAAGDFGWFGGLWLLLLAGIRRRA